MEEITDNNVPATPPQVAPSSRQPMSLFKKIFLIMFGTVCFFGVWNTVIPLLFPKQPSVNPNNASNISPSMTVNLKTFTNKKYKYSVKYPDTVAVSEETPYSAVFTITPKPVARLVFPSFYISVIPDGFTKKDDVYNFISAETINKFYTMQDNEVLQTETGTNAEYWNFKKLAVISVAGENGVMIQNDNVFEGNGLINRRILVKKNGVTYMIGSYFQSQEELTHFQKFVESFTFLTNKE